MARWTKVTGAPGAPKGPDGKPMPGGGSFITSGHFPSYNTDVVLTISDIQWGQDVDLENGEKGTGLFAFFEKTPRQLFLRGHHQRSLTRVFGKKTVERWRGPVALYCAEKSHKAGGEVYDQVKIREKAPRAPQKPQDPSGEPELREAPNAGGGPGSLGDPAQPGEVAAPVESPKEPPPGDWALAAPVEEGTCGRQHPDVYATCCREAGHDTYCDWADQETGDPLPEGML